MSCPLFPFFLHYICMFGNGGELGLLHFFGISILHLMGRKKHSQESRYGEPGLLSNTLHNERGEKIVE